MTLSEFKTEFMAVLNNRLCTTTLRDLFINQGLLRIRRELRSRVIEADETFTVADPYTGVPLPDDYEELRDLIFDGSQLPKRDLTTVLQLALQTGRPIAYARQGDKWLLGPQPVVDDEIEILYYASADIPSTDGASNSFLNTHNDLLLFAALSFAGEHFVDRRLERWEGRFQSTMQAINDKAVLEGTDDGQVKSAYNMDMDEV